MANIEALANLAILRGMVGKRYDPLMGKLWDVLGRVGFVVCIDVTTRSWLASGRSMICRTSPSQWQ